MQSEKIQFITDYENTLASVLRNILNKIASADMEREFEDEGYTPNEGEMLNFEKVTFFEDEIDTGGAGLVVETFGGEKVRLTIHVE